MREPSAIKIIHKNLRHAGHNIIQNNVACNYNTFIIILRKIGSAKLVIVLNAVIFMSRGVYFGSVYPSGK